MSATPPDPSRPSLNAIHHKAKARSARSSSLKLAGSKRQFVRWRGRASEKRASTAASQSASNQTSSASAKTLKLESRAASLCSKTEPVSQDSVLIFVVLRCKSNLHPAEGRSHLPRHPGPAATWAVQAWFRSLGSKGLNKDCGDKGS